MSTIDINKVKTYVDLVKDAAISGFSIDDGNFKLEIEQDFVQNSSNKKTIVEAVTESPKTEKNLQEPKVEIKAEDKFKQLKADRIGIFYLNENQGEPFFVTEGQKVKKGDPVCIIKAMRIKNIIKAESDFTVKRILAKEDLPVEYGQVLMEIV